ncbi:hypothetical protein SBRCBS47491_010074 [Sporothrix bragantina]|uniref:Acyltransferase 3 domain-containing protein n=1 Tax=Sporothrix bragantina TaxID=671064 RepID=A0ABP0CZV1_9PEZI
MENGNGLLDSGSASSSGESQQAPLDRYVDGHWVSDIEANSANAGNPPTKHTPGIWTKLVVRPAQAVWKVAYLPNSTAPLRPTAYLDGLRGFAAFLVYIHHNELWAHAASTEGDNAAFENAWGFEHRRHFATLPFVRNFFTGGHIAVAIFYVISGYVLCAKPLSLVMAGEHLKLLDSMASSFFRRWFRLYIPIFATTFIYVTSWHVFGNYWVSNSDQHATILEEYWNWYVELKNFTFLFKEGTIWVTFNTHLWSIPFEMRGSMMVFILMLVIYRVTTFYRHCIMLGLAFYFIYIVDAYYCCMFMVGVYLCYLDLLAKRGELPNWIARKKAHKYKYIIPMYIVGLYLAGVPSQRNDLDLLRKNPGWYYLSFLKPQAVFDPKWFYLTAAAGLIVGCTQHLPPVKRFFEGAFCQYLGHISYSLYLVHGPVISSVGDRVYAMTGWYRKVEDHQKMLEWWINRFYLPSSGPMGLEFSFLAPQIIIAPVTFILANLVTKYIDEPAVRFPAWMYKKVCGGDSTPAPSMASRPEPSRPADPQRLE